MVLYERSGDDIDRGLVGYWKLDDLKVSTSTAIDRANFNDGSIVGATLGSDINGNKIAMSFDGIDDQIVLPDDILNGATNFSASLWVKPVIENGSDHNLLALSYDYGGVRNGGINFHIEASDDANYPNQLSIFYNGNVTYYHFDISATNDWMHIVLQTDGTKMTCYKNSILIKEQSCPTLVADGGLYDTIGYEFNKWLKGQINKVRVYNRPLTAGEINKLYRLRK